VMRSRRSLLAFYRVKLGLGILDRVGYKLTETLNCFGFDSLDPSAFLVAHVNIRDSWAVP
jgi:hypothetical protein